MGPEQLAELARWRLVDFAPDAAYEAEYRSSSRFIAIGGSGRSGTTLLRRMLGASQALVDGPESYLLLPIPLNLTELGARYALPPSCLRDLETDNRWAFIDRFQQIVTRRHDEARCWVDKTARNVHCFTYVAQRFPYATFVHVVRDPRNVVLSLRTHPRNSRRWGDPKPTGWQQPWDACIERWALAVKDAVTAAKSIPVITVRYEDLVDTPRQSLESLASSAGFSFDESMLRPEQRRVGPGEGRYIPNNERALTELTTARVGRWRKDLPTQIRTTIEARLSSQMSLYGYEV